MVGYDEDFKVSVVVQVMENSKEFAFLAFRFWDRFWRVSFVLA